MALDVLPGNRFKYIYPTCMLASFNLKNKISRIDKAQIMNSNPTKNVRMDYHLPNGNRQS